MIEFYVFLYFIYVYLFSDYLLGSTFVHFHILLLFLKLDIQK